MWGGSVRRFVMLAVSAALLVPGAQVVLPSGAAASVDGTYTVLAGGGVGDGLPATSVYLPAVATGTDAAGATYLADTVHGRVRRVDPTSGQRSRAGLHGRRWPGDRGAALGLDGDGGDGGR